MYLFNRNSLLLAVDHDFVVFVTTVAAAAYNDVGVVEFFSMKTKTFCMNNFQ